MTRPEHRRGGGSGPQDAAATAVGRALGMRNVRDASVVVDQGEADAYARWYADRLDLRGGLARGLSVRSHAC